MIYISCTPDEVRDFLSEEKSIVEIHKNQSTHDKYILICILNLDGSFLSLIIDWESQRFNIQLKASFGVVRRIDLANHRALSNCPRQCRAKSRGQAHCHMWINKYVGIKCIRSAPNYDLGKNGYPNEILDKFFKFLNETNINLSEEIRFLPIPERRPQRIRGGIQTNIGEYT